MRICLCVVRFPNKISEEQNDLVFSQCYCYNVSNLAPNFNIFSALTKISLELYLKPAIFYLQPFKVTKTQSCKSEVALIE